MSHLIPSPISYPAVHSVHFYDQDEALIHRLCSIVSSAVNVGNSIVIVATQEHRVQLTAELKQQVGNLVELRKQGRLVLCDAEQLLKKFMRGETPDAKRFLASAGELIATARQSAWNQQKGLTVFGEMVAILWNQGNKTGALQLETLWNDLLSHRSFHLHCAYPRTLFADGQDGDGFRAICEGHSHVVGCAAA